MKQKAYVLLSGGIDSSTCLAIAVKDVGAPNVTAISIGYGQRHHKEISCALEVCKYFAVAHEEHELLGVPKVMLTDPSVSVPNISYQDIVGVSPTYVPFRNGQLLSKVAGIAAHRVEVLNKQISNYDVLTTEDPWTGSIYFGAHAEDAAGDAYPDCRLDFVGAMGAAIYIGTYHSVRLRAPLIEMFKVDIIRKGVQLGVPYHLTWSCYKGEELHCGVCPTCRARRNAFHDCSISDPTEYAANP